MTDYEKCLRNSERRLYQLPGVSLCAPNSKLCPTEFDSSTRRMYDMICCLSLNWTKALQSP